MSGGVLAVAAGALAFGNGIVASRRAGQGAETFDLRRPLPDPAAAEREAKVVLAKTPMDAAAVRRLAIARAQAGDAAGTAQALQIAGALGWRDTPTQIILASQALAAGDLATAVQRADALARRKAAQAETFLLLRTIERAPGGDAALAERLALAPLWRTPYLQDVAVLGPEDLTPREALYARLAVGTAKLSDEEVAPYVARLIATGNYGRARRAWLRWGGHRGKEAALLQDGGFSAIDAEEKAQPDGFGWQASSPVGSALEREADAGRGKAALRVESDGTASGVLLSQLILLEPGSHAFSVVRRDSSAAAGDMFRWSFRCLNGGDTVPVEMRAVGPATGGSRMTGSIVVPAGCPAQMLSLTARSGSLPEQQSAWFEDASVTR